MSEVIICEYRNDDRMSCIKLLERTFPGRGGEEDFVWRFESIANNPLIVCAKHKDDIVGFHAFIPWRFALKNEHYIGYQGIQAATDNNYQRQGIQNRLIKYACELASEKGADFMWGGLPQHYNHKAYYKSGFYQVAYFPLYRKIVCPFIRKHLEIAKVDANKPIGIMLREENKITPIVDDYYLKWRYFKNPNEYDIIKISKNNDEAMFCVRQRKLWHGMIRISTSDLLILDCQLSSLDNIFVEWAFKTLESMFSAKVSTISTFFNDSTDRGKAISKYFTWKSSKPFQALMLLPGRKDLDVNVFLNKNNWDVLPHIIDWY